MRKTVHAQKLVALQTFAKLNWAVTELENNRWHHMIEVTKNQLFLTKLS